MRHRESIVSASSNSGNKPERLASSALESLRSKLNDALALISPSPEMRARREALAIQWACCVLFVELARVGPLDPTRRRETVARAMREQFAIADEDLLPMIADASRLENRLTSYYGPVALINKCYSPEQKVRFIEELWRVAMADGEIDIYEEHLVRKLAELAYVAHADFILAKHRVEDAAIPVK
jgi:uncharacterized tellurite resistance protein B-like protein